MQFGYVIECGKPVQQFDCFSPVAWVEEDGRRLCRRVRYIDAENWELAKKAILLGAGREDEDVGEVLSQMAYGPVPIHSTDNELLRHFEQRLRAAYMREKERMEKVRNQKEYNDGFEKGKKTGYKQGRAEAEAEAAALISSDV